MSSFRQSARDGLLEWAKTGVLYDRPAVGLQVEQDGELARGRTAELTREKPAGRVVKRPDVRRGELVDCARALFFTKGYEATTVADIIARAGVSKGGFYHHFLSKEELLDAMVAQITAEIVAAAQDVLADGSLDALTKLNRFLLRGQEWKVQSAPALWALVSVLFKPENAPLYQRMVNAAVTAVGPVLTRIVEDGIAAGTFDVPDAGIVAELLLHLSNARQALLAEALKIAERGDVEGAAQMIENRIHREEALINRMLGLPAGSFRMVEPEYLRQMLTALPLREGA